jgi:hypothetical protein
VGGQVPREALGDEGLHAVLEREQDHAHGRARSLLGDLGVGVRHRGMGRRSGRVDGAPFSCGAHRLLGSLPRLSPLVCTLVSVVS